ncbi:MAG: RES family NAD+ phosphorylase [Gammaproteobacteria bacterium]|nr:RES family NAD+ phosphorylase [Gammaproteobacteria bacterium]
MNKVCLDCLFGKDREEILQLRVSPNICDLCDESSDEVSLLSDIAPLVEHVLEEYTFDELFFENSRNLKDLLVEDWGIFPHANSNRLCFEAIDKIFNLSGNKTSESAHWENTDLLKDVSLDIWSGFEEEIKHQKRFVTSTSLSVFLEEMLPVIESDIPKGILLFRCRLANSPMRDVWVTDPATPPIHPQEMGMPPRRMVVDGGRANPAGIAVFYGAEDETTAILETRPDLTKLASVAEFEVMEPLRLVDFTVNFAPDMFSSDVRGQQTTKLLLPYIDRAFSLPVSQREASIDYVPTQYIAQQVFQAGYDGFRFSSSLNPGGRNIVLHDERKIWARRSVLKRFEQFSVRYRDSMRSEATWNDTEFTSKGNEFDDDVPF